MVINISIFISMRVAAQVVALAQLQSAQPHFVCGPLPCPSSSPLPILIFIVISLAAIVMNIVVRTHRFL